MINRLYKKVYPSHGTAVDKAHLYHHGARGNMILPVSVNHIQDSCLLILTKNINYSIRCQILHHIKMSDLVLKLAGDAKVRGTTTYDDMQVFSVFDCISLVCQKTAAYSRQLWMRLMSEDSVHKDELDELFTVE